MISCPSHQTHNKIFRAVNPGFAAYRPPRSHSVFVWRICKWSSFDYQSPYALRIGQLCYDPAAIRSWTFDPWDLFPLTHVATIQGISLSIQHSSSGSNLFFVQRLAPGQSTQCSYDGQGRRFLSIFGMWANPAVVNTSPAKFLVQNKIFLSSAR